MTDIPRFDITQVDGALGTLPPDAYQAKVGVCSAGPVNTPTLIGSKGQLSDTFGTGPLCEAVAYQLDLTQAPVLVCRATGSGGAALGSVVRYGAGTIGASLATDPGNTSTAVATLSVTGTLARPYAVRVRVSQAGANLAAAPQIQYSLDGGLTWSTAMVALAGPVALGSSGLSLSWADGSFVAANSWTGQGARAATGAATMAVTGSPLDAYDVIVRIVRGAANLAANLATYRVSLDGGITFGPELAMPTGGTVSLASAGVSLVFANGGGGGGTAFVAGDELAFRTTAPETTLSYLQAAWEALMASPYDAESVHVVGAIDATVATALDVLATAAVGDHKPRWVIVETRAPRADESMGAWRSAIIADFEDFVSDRVIATAGRTELLSVLTTRYAWRSAGTVVAARAALVPISEDLAWVARGALPGVRAIDHDEDATPGLNAARFTTLRQHQGRRGYYITNPLTMAEAGSDYQLLQYRRVWDRAYRVVRAAGLGFLSADVLVNPSGVQAPLVPGAIDEVDAGNFEELTRDALMESLVRTTPRHATDVEVTVDRSNNVLSTQLLNVDWAITPKGYLKRISGRLGFENPGRNL